MRARRLPAKRSAAPRSSRSARSWSPRTAYESARKRLSEGRGNVIRQAELLRELGVKPNKSLPSELVEAANAEPLALPEERKAG